MDTSVGDKSVLVIAHYHLIVRIAPDQSLVAGPCDDTAYDLWPPLVEANSLVMDERHVYVCSEGRPGVIDTARATWTLLPVAPNAATRGLLTRVERLSRQESKE